MLVKTSSLVIIFVLLFFLGACSQAVETPAGSYTWEININKAEVRDSLKTTEVVTLYNGEKDEVKHENLPAAGNIFLLLSLDLKNPTARAAVLNGRICLLWTKMARVISVLKTILFWSCTALFHA